MADLWDEAREILEPDGSLLDIYVHNSTVDEMDRVIQGIRSIGWPTTYFEGGSPAEIPSAAADIFGRGDGEYESTTMMLFVDGTQINCHFFVPDLMEFDVDPVEVATEEGFANLVTFLLWLGRLLGKHVTLTPENTPEAPILRYSAESDTVEYCWAGEQA